jgi:hypothetical protein
MPVCDTTAFVAAIQPLAQRWTDATTLAGNTPRASLAPQISELQAIRREVQALAVPSCAEPTRESLVAAMDSTIQAYLDFLAQKPESEVTAGFEAAAAHMATFTARLASLASPEAALAATNVALTPTATTVVPPTPTPAPVPQAAVAQRVSDLFTARGWSVSENNAARVLSGPDGGEVRIVGSMERPTAITLTHPYTGEAAQLQVFMDFARAASTDAERGERASQWVKDNKAHEGIAYETISGHRMRLTLYPRRGEGELRVTAAN